MVHDVALAIAGADLEAEGRAQPVDHFSRILVAQRRVEPGCFIGGWHENLLQTGWSITHSVRRPLARLEEMLPQRRRRIAGELAELADQMRLVGIATIGGDIGPVAVVLPRQAE